MNSDTLTVRLSADLSKALRRIAKKEGVAKSQIVREAVATYLAPAAPTSMAQGIAANKFAALWRNIPRLTPDEALDFEKEIETAGNDLTLPQSAWE